MERTQQCALTIIISDKNIQDGQNREEIDVFTLEHCFSFEKNCPTKQYWTMSGDI